MSNATATALRFHRKDRATEPVGTLKNGATVYRLTTRNGENVYLVRRAAKSETAKGYTQAKECTPTELAGGTFNAKGEKLARARFNVTLDHLMDVPQLHAKAVASDADSMAEMMSCAIGEVQDRKSNGAVYMHVRRTSEPVQEIIDGRPVLCIDFEKMWAEGSRWHADGWQADGARYRAPGYYAEEDAKAARELSRLQKAVEGFEARHTIKA